MAQEKECFVFQFILHIQKLYFDASSSVEGSILGECSFDKLPKWEASIQQQTTYSLLSKDQPKYKKAYQRTFDTSSVVPNIFYSFNSFPQQQKVWLPIVI